MSTGAKGGIMTQETGGWHASEKTPEVGPWGGASGCVRDESLRGLRAACGRGVVVGGVGEEKGREEKGGREMWRGKDGAEGGGETEN